MGKQTSSQRRERGEGMTGQQRQVGRGLRGYLRAPRSVRVPAGSPARVGRPYVSAPPPLLLLSSVIDPSPSIPDRDETKRFLCYVL